jgi:hypothetical protein
MGLVRVLHLLALLMRHQKRIWCHWLLLRCGRRMLRVRRLLWHSGRCVWRVVHRLLDLAWGLTVDWPSMLIMLW